MSLLDASAIIAGKKIGKKLANLVEICLVKTTFHIGRRLNEI